MAMSLAELLTKKREPVGLRSYEVYLLPGIAILVGWLLMATGHRPSVAVGCAVVCAAISLAGLWMLLTAEMGKALGIRIEEGLWLTMAAYLVLVLAASASALPRAGQEQVERWFGRGARQGRVLRLPKDAHWPDDSGYRPPPGPQPRDFR